MQFIGSLSTMMGAGIFLLCINFKLGLATIAPGVRLPGSFTKATIALGET